MEATKERAARRDRATRARKSGSQPAHGSRTQSITRRRRRAKARIRLGDKLARFNALTKEGGQQVSDESIRDTLIDLANYAIMTVMELDEQKVG